MPHPKGGYRLKDGTKVPGVTTIIGRFKESGGLIWWAYRQGQANPDGHSPYEETEKAASIGTLAHGLVEAHLHGQNPLELIDFVMADPDHKEKAEQAYRAYLRWEMQTQVKIVATEIKLVSNIFEYGGCPDAIFEMPDETYELGDWKTSNATYPDHIIQLAAYGQLWLENLPFTLPDGRIVDKPLTGYNLLRFAKDAPDFHHHRFEDLSEEFEQFKDFRRCYRRDLLIKKRVK